MCIIKLIAFLLRVENHTQCLRSAFLGSSLHTQALGIPNHMMAPKNHASGS